MYTYFIYIKTYIGKQKLYTNGVTIYRLTVNNLPDIGDVYCVKFIYGIRIECIRMS